MNNPSEEKQLVFIISQPRSGSTLLQSIVSNNEEVATASEPWLLFHFLGYFHPELIEAKYSYDVAYKATQDFFEKTEFQDSIKEEVNCFISRIYARTIGTEKKVRYILDKTPRYYEIIDSIRLVFPEAKIIILKRNPLAVLNSIIHAWAPKMSNLQLYHRDILYAPFLLQNFIDNNNDPSILITHYETIVSDPINEVKKIYQWLNIDFKEEFLNYSNNPKFAGKYGDSVGIHKHDEPEKKEEEWTNMLTNSKWKNFFKGYAFYLGKDFLASYGYSLSDRIFKETRIFNTFKFIAEKDIPNQESVRKNFFKHLYYRSAYKLYSQ